MWCVQSGKLRSQVAGKLFGLRNILGEIPQQPGFCLALWRYDTRAQHTRVHGTGMVLGLGLLVTRRGAICFSLFRLSFHYCWSVQCWVVARTVEAYLSYWKIRCRHRAVLVVATTSGELQNVSCWSSPRAGSKCRTDQLSHLSILFGMALSEHILWRAKNGHIAWSVLKTISFIRVLWWFLETWDKPFAKQTQETIKLRASRKSHDATCWPGRGAHVSENGKKALLPPYIHKQKRAKKKNNFFGAVVVGSWRYV
jgi:hypothetical protein